MTVAKTWTNAICALLALVAGSAASSSDSPVTDRWMPDPEEQYLLDVRLRTSRLGDGVRAYSTPEGNCIVLGDFLTTLDVPMKIDLETQKASGWAFSEENRISIDRGAQVAETNGNREAIATSDIRDTAEGWCVDTDALSRWFGIEVQPNMMGAVLTLESEAKLPVELAAERRRRAETLKAAADFDYSELPQVKLPYRMWRTPALDVVVNAGAVYSAHSGVQFDQSAALYASGELAGMSFDARLSARDDGGREELRLRAYRSDPAGEMLGPLKATHVELGDLVHGSNGVGTRYGNGRGALLTNRPLRRLANFDRVSFEGELPAGWDAELYRNGQILAFATQTDDGRYLFEDIQLSYGANEVEIVLYGPQGQVRRRVEEVMVGAQQLPPGESWYFASVSQPDRGLLTFGDTSEDFRPVDAQATIALDHGIDQRTSVGVLAQALLMGDETVTWVEGSVRRTVGPAYVEASASYNSRGGTALRGRAVTAIGPASVALSSEIQRGPTIEPDSLAIRGQHELSASVPIKIGRQKAPLSTRIRLTDFADGTHDLSTSSRFSMGVGRINMGAEVDWQRRGIGGIGPRPRDRVMGRLVGSGRVGRVRLQTSTDFDLADLRLDRAEVNAFWSAGERAAWDAGVAFEPTLDRFRARVAHVRRFDVASVALTAEAASDGSLAAGINLAFSLDAPNGTFRPTAQTLARTGSVKARIFRDDNANGRRDDDEPYQQGVALTAGLRTSDMVSNDEGEVVLAGLATHMPIAIGIDHDSLGDPSLTPAEALRVLVPRPGVTGEIEIPLVGAGLVEGTIANASGPVEGIELLLKDRAGRTVAKTRTDFDGYFLFEQVAYGQYRITLSTMAANVLMVEASIDVPITVTPDMPYARTGTIGLTHDPSRIAEARAPPVTLEGRADMPAAGGQLLAESEFERSQALDTAAIVDTLVGGDD